MIFRAVVMAGLMASCLAGPVYAQDQTDRVGGDKDAHGCYSSAGYSYSSLRKSCIRIWEAGVALDPVKPLANTSVVGYVVFASRHDRRQAELFLPDDEGPRL